MKSVRKLLSSVLFFNMFFILNAQNYILVERSDLRRYDNGKYIGLLSREVRSFIVPSKTSDGLLYNGYFYVNQNTKRNNVSVNDGINDAILSSFSIDDENGFRMLVDNGYPSFRGFPSFVENEIKPGDTWECSSERSVDPLENGINTRMPVLVKYTYVKDMIYNGTEVYVLNAFWATRYGGFSNIIDEEGDSSLLSAQGKNDAVIYVDKKSLKALLISDRVEETFSYADGKKVTFKGTVSIFTENPMTVNKEAILEKIPENETRFEFEKTDMGLKFILSDIRFAPDSSEILEGEGERLDKIAELLKNAPDSMFLIEGHTASTGNPKGEMQLSVERAHAIVRELAKRGISSSRFICKGWGGTKPVSDNETPEGKARNRRVEITILE
ncbi:MAG: OmpA family protein [Treponema sp.]|nr:OmpA family protein [Treponema sp.]